MYREWQGRVGGVTVWTRAAAAGGSQEYRVLPDGCMDLIWRDGALLVAGPDTAAYVAEESARTVYAGLRFAPGRGRGCWASRPARSATGACRWTRCGRPRGARRLAERAEHDPAAALESWAAARTRRVGRPRGRADVPRARGRPGSGAAPSPRSRPGRASGSGSCAAAARRSSATGPRRSPASCASSARWRWPVRARRSPQVAVEAGYADQPHLAREVRALTGVPLGATSWAGQGVLPSSAEGAAAPAAAKRSTPLPSGSWTTA